MVGSAVEEAAQVMVADWEGNTGREGRVPSDRTLSSWAHLLKVMPCPSNTKFKTKPLKCQASRGSPNPNITLHTERHKSGKPFLLRG